MATATGDLVFDFSAELNANPFSISGITSIESMQVLAGLYKAGSVGVLSRSYCNTALDEDIISSEVEMGYTSAVFSDNTCPALIKSNGEGFYIRMNGDQMRVRKVDAAGVTSELTDADYTGTTYVVGDRFRIAYNTLTNQITTYKNDILQATKTADTYTQGGASGSFFAGILSDLQNSGLGGISSFGAGGIAEAGVSVDSITDPIIGTEPVTIVLTEADASIDTIEFTAGTVTQAQSFTTSDDTEFVIATPTRNLLPPIGTVTVTLKDGVTEITSTTATLQEPAGWGVQVGSGIVDEEAVPHTGTLVDGMIAYWDDYPNTLINAAFSDITQVIPRAVNFYIWDPVAEEYGTVSAFTYNAGTFTRLLHAKPIFGKALIAKALQASAL